MANYPMNIWVIDENEFDRFTFTGGKVIYIVEEPDFKYRTHPSIITAGALLPPIESIQAELNGNILESNAIYERYLHSEEADPYISIIIAAALKQIPIGIMFGKDELNMQFPKMFVEFLYKFYGLVLGVNDMVVPYIAEEMIPIDLAKLYCMNIIDYPTFMEKHPALPIHPIVISKMAIEINPIIKDKTILGYTEYFEHVRKTIGDNGGKYLIDPMVAI